MTSNESRLSEHHHGVCVAIHGKGILITGDPGSGKSSLALDLLHHGHQLIADDSVECHYTDHVIAHCPPLLQAMLHTRELGLMNVTDIFGQQAWQSSHRLDYVVQLHPTAIDSPSSLTPTLGQYTIGTHALPLLHLSLANPASLCHRLETWVKLQTHGAKTAQQFQQQHRTLLNR